jgi:hypothetical protein
VYESPHEPLRTLLVECVNHVLGPHGRDSTLRQWCLHLAHMEAGNPAIGPSSPLLTSSTFGFSIGLTLGLIGKVLKLPALEGTVE